MEQDTKYSGEPTENELKWLSRLGIIAFSAFLLWECLEGYELYQDTTKIIEAEMGLRK